MQNKKRGWAAFCVTLLLLFLGYYSIVGNKMPEADLAQDNAERLVLWYTDETMTDYFNALALEYYESKGVRVEPVLKSGIDFLSEAAEAEEDKPDMLMVSNASLQEAVLLNIASEVRDTFNRKAYSPVAIKSCTNDYKIVAYPLCYDTVALAVNETYLKNYAKDQIESERAQEEAEEAFDEGREALETLDADEEEIELKAEEYIPESFAELMEFAENYDAPEKVKALLGWDTSDVFYNYFILGDSIELAGPAGDSEGLYRVEGSESQAALLMYKDLTDFFSLDEGESDYVSIRDAFARGEYVFAIAGTDILKSIDNAVLNGDMDCETEFYPLMAISDQIKAKPLSVTQTICVNSKSEHTGAAAGFAEYAVDEKRAQLLYDKAGKLMPQSGACGVNKAAAHFLKEYENSVPVPKLTTLSDFWMKLEIAFLEVREGEDVSLVLSKLAK